MDIMTRFQSTRPIRGATDECPSGKRTREFQSTRPIRGATSQLPPYLCDSHISIHAPHTGRDNRCAPAYFRNLIFQSTRPIRGATMMPIHKP